MSDDTFFDFKIFYDNAVKYDFKIFYANAVKYVYSTDNVLRSDHSWWGSITLENFDIKPENDPNLDIEDVVD